MHEVWADIPGVPAWGESGDAERSPESLVSDALDTYKHVADDPGMDHQVCRNHVKRNVIVCLTFRKTRADLLMRLFPPLFPFLEQTRPHSHWGFTYGKLCIDC